MPSVSVGRDPPRPNLRFGHASGVISGSLVIPVAGLSLLLVRIQTVDPWHLRCQTPRQIKPGFFYYRAMSAIGT
jgi:hypothetical protein